MAAAQDFLAHFPDDPEAPETRYYLAQALKAEGQTGEALRQVMAFLQAEKKSAGNHPEVWAYWQQRVGNEIANSLYKEGDYVKALEIYLSLARLDSAPAWQLPVKYQVGITYEHLLQPEKAVATYNEILARESAVGTNATPDLQAVFEMARWRAGFIRWQGKAEPPRIHFPKRSPSPTIRHQLHHAMNPIPTVNFAAQVAADLRAFLSLCEEALALATCENQIFTGGPEYRPCGISPTPEKPASGLDQAVVRLKNLRRVWQQTDPAEREQCDEVKSLFQAVQGDVDESPSARSGKPAGHASPGVGAGAASAGGGGPAAAFRRRPLPKACRRMNCQWCHGGGRLGK